jgi:hypothetical protein
VKRGYDENSGLIAGLGIDLTEQRVIPIWPVYHGMHLQTLVALGKCLKHLLIGLSEGHA